MAPPPAPVSANQGDARRLREPSSLYKLIMTPLMFTSFLLSLALVDLRHSAVRAHYHADASQPSRLPRWLHSIIYRYRPYRYVVVDERGQPVGKSPGTPTSPGSPGSEARREDYYHSKQRELVKMEAAEAFEIRGTVLIALALLNLAVLWAFWLGLSAVWAWVS